MVFLLAQQAPEPQQNTISRINSDAAYEILKKFCSSLSQKLECTVLCWWWCGRIITILVEFSVFWKGLHTIVAFCQTCILQVDMGKAGYKRICSFV